MNYQDHIHEKIREKSSLLKICTMIHVSGRYPPHYEGIGGTAKMTIFMVTLPSLIVRGAGVTVRGGGV